jgi:hypothetical protein
MKGIVLLLLVCCQLTWANSILIPMDDSQRNHLKAYGIAFYILHERHMEMDWLLNYRGGSFLVQYSPEIENECTVRGVSFERVAEATANRIRKEIMSPAVNMNIVRMEQAPRIAVYSPKNEFLLDETDAVITVLDYAEIPYTIIYDEQVIHDELAKYDWLHIHHEDFTGQPERLRWRESAKMEAELQRLTMQKLGYTNVTAMKLDVAKKIKAFCAGGGYLFAMCSGAETIDIALAAEGNNFENMDDNETESPLLGRLDFSKTFAFENFTLESAYSRRFSDINIGGVNFSERSRNFFALFEFSAKYDVIPSLLTQNHEQVIKEFHGLTTAFNKDVVKASSQVLGENRNQKNVRYIYGEMGRGHWTFYSGHDPEGSPGRWREPTDLNQFPHSPGYRLILNNVLFPSAKKKKQKT